MSQLIALMQQHPGFGFSSQYVMAGAPWNSLLAFHNYFDEVFPGKDIGVRLHLVFHDAQGRETLVHEQWVEPAAAVQVDCNAIGVPGPGVVAMAAVADADLTALADGKFKIKRPVTTGFYITWEHDERWRDTMHEWAGVSSQPAPDGVQHVGFAASDEPVTCGLVLTNPTTAPTAAGPCEVRLRATDGRLRLAPVAIDPLPPMGSRVLKMHDLFADFEALLDKHRQLVVDVRSSQHAPPLTAEWHRSGDFHIHHI